MSFDDKAAAVKTAKAIKKAHPAVQSLSMMRRASSRRLNTSVIQQRRRDYPIKAGAGKLFRLTEGGVAGVRADLSLKRRNSSHMASSVLCSG